MTGTCAILPSSNLKFSTMNIIIACFLIRLANGYKFSANQQYASTIVEKDGMEFNELPTQSTDAITDLIDTRKTPRPSHGLLDHILYQKERQDDGRTITNYSQNSWNGRSWSTKTVFENDRVDNPVRQHPLTPANGVKSRIKRWIFPEFWSLDDDDFYLCFDPPCPHWSQWHGKDRCDSSCGGGKRLLVRYCENARAEEDQGGCKGEKTRIESCNMQSCPSWSDWMPNGSCSATCGAGVQTFKRICTKGGRTANGCIGRNSLFRTCENGQSCPAQWTTWTKFGPCTKTCGGHGFQLRKRICVKDGRKIPLKLAKTECKGYSAQQKRCSAPSKCGPKFSDWSSWSYCDATACDSEGMRTRTRHCLQSNTGMANCAPDSLTEVQRCRSLPCVKSCKVLQTQFHSGSRSDSAKVTDFVSTWSQWSRWSDCSVSCGLGGRQSRRRMCFSVRVDETSGIVILSEDSSCKGQSVQESSCHYNDDCPEWGEWQGWNKCSKQCGVDGRKRRERQCEVNIYEKMKFTEQVIHPNQSRVSDDERDRHIGMKNSSNPRIDSYPATQLWRGEEGTKDRTRILIRKVSVSPNWCEGDRSYSVETAACNQHPCLPEWGEWQSWSECSVTCGQGQMLRSRKCSTGRCHGTKDDIKTCYHESCKGAWSSYTPCSKSCGVGVKMRYRNLIGVSGEQSADTKNNSQISQETDTVTCNEEICPIWDEWSSWGECSASCQKGEKSRTRKCIQGKCTGETVDTMSCNYQPCPYWTEWATFSCCSASCGEGTKSRSRFCMHGLPGQGSCTGNDTDVQICSLRQCNEPVVPQLNPSLCGLRPQKPALLKIFNGKISGDHQWPWQTSWQHLSCVTGRRGCKWEHQCGATLVGSRWVITAAHCIENGEYRVNVYDPGDTWSVVVGMTRLHETGTRHYIRQVFVIDGYKRYPVPTNDVALMKLMDSVTIRKTVMPACLPTNHITSEGEECFITGWGNTHPFSRTSLVLREAEVPIVNFTTCAGIESDYKDFLSQDKHMCAGDIESTQIADSCEGDSGGPLVCVKPSGRWYLAGITSFGFTDCGVSGHPGIYAPTVKYERWIRETISKFTHDGC